MTQAPHSGQANTLDGQDALIPVSDTASRLILTHQGQIVPDEFHSCAEMTPEAISATEGHLLLTTTQLETMADQISAWRASGRQIGVLLTVEDSPEQKSLPFDQVDLIAIEFAGFADGRGYSFATLLRRQGYQGELRAVGDVFQDTLFYLKRCGFTQFAIKPGKVLEQTKTGLRDFSKGYQLTSADPYTHYQTGKGIGSGVAT